MRSAQHPQRRDLLPASCLALPEPEDTAWGLLLYPGSWEFGRGLGEAAEGTSQLASGRPRLGPPDKTA